RPRASCQQCAAVGRTRHGQELSGQGGAWRSEGPQARLDSSRRHRIASASPCALACRERASLHPVLRRPFLRSGGHVLQIAEGRAERGIEGRPPNVLFYAPSNGGHLMAREMVDNERSTAINPGEAVEEKLSLSDRFGLWIGFHNCSQDDYLDIVRSYARYYRLAIKDET